MTSYTQGDDGEPNAVSPYSDGIEHLRAELRRLDLRLLQYLHEWSDDRGGGSNEFTGLYVSDDEVVRLLRPDSAGRDSGESGTKTTGRAGTSVSGGSQRGATTPSLGDRYREVAQRCADREQATVEAGTRLPLVELASTFDLDSVQRDALLLALAPALDEKYEKVFGYLLDDITRIRPTVGLLCRVLASGDANRLALRRRFGSDLPLFDSRLVTVGGDPDAPLLSRPIYVEEAVVAYLLGTEGLAGELATIATLSRPSQTLAELAIDDERRNRVAALASRTTTQPGKPLCAAFHGPYGSAAPRAVDAIASRTETPVLRIDATDLAGDRFQATIERLHRDASIHVASIHVTGFDALWRDESDDGAGGGPEHGPTAGRVLRALDSFDGPVFLTGERAIPVPVRRVVDRHEFTGIAFDVPGFEQRRALWRQVDGLPDDVDVSEISSTFRLTAGQIADAVTAARTATSSDTPSRAALYEACRAQSREQLDDLATHVKPNYTFDDIVLPANADEHLREVASHVTRRAQVFAEWGFESKFSLGNGLNVLFAGPSGTGKTMAAEVVANHAGLDLYKIDLSSVVSKYVGETESNLRRVFDEAANTNAVLFFDEADALFGKRSSVSDAQDRYANVEVSYLLQRMEAHDGTTILATNFKGNLDDAFERRINATIEFPLPDRESRDAIWRGMFPSETPVGDLDFDFLADFELVGGNIKNAALTAAFLAAEDDTPVEMQHVVRAVYRELEKSGKLVNLDQFGEYAHILEDIDT